ncbi:hypothetical protein RRF57_012326 [Xylaria bambusicola]|uniref:Uncharacterized protein n=1 Tax=Xylaria bambusicola TaxID=326684 RepID=A0AAN7V419_9PEZI
MATSTSSSSIAATLQWPAGVNLEYPGSDAFENAIKRWSVYEAPIFDYSLSPVDEKQVTEIVRTSDTPTL